MNSYTIVVTDILGRDYIFNVYGWSRFDALRAAANTCEENNITPETVEIE